MNYLLTLRCPDKKGIVGEICSLLSENQGFILELSQFGDPETKLFFMRALVEMEDKNSFESFKKALQSLESSLNIDWEFHSPDYKQKAILFVSRESHCLNHLLYQAKNDLLPIVVQAVISNHPDLESMTKGYNVPFIHLPVTPKTKKDQQQQILDTIDKFQPDLVILARYMQILPSEICQKLVGKAINIHHSFLPSFKGAKPYRQAYQKGVKLIGATAHYVTDDLDEGPIIEQEVVRVDHTFTPKKLVILGKDIECRVLSSAIKWHTEKRVFVNQNKTVIFK